MSLLVISGVVIRVGGRTLLNGADLTIDPGRRIGLVGRNGAGKSTLLRAIAGDLAVDGGEIRLNARARMATVRQEAPEGPSSLLDTVLQGDPERLALLAELETADPHRMAEIHERLIAIGAESAPARAATILAGLGFDEAAQARPVAEFSGGWRMRVALATALFANPDLLLLDEPTNHLDLEATLWLESWLARFPGAALVVSHDRGLLDRAVEAIAHLDKGKLSLTPGGFDEFVRIRTERAMQQARAAEKVAAERAHIQSFIDRFRYKASKARQAQARIKALERLPQIETVIEDAPTRFAFPDPPRIAPPILALDRVDIGYGATRILRNVSLTVDMDDRIALLGANGNGKSTLAKLLAERLDPMSGEVRRGPKLKVGYFAQHQTDELVLSETPVDHMSRALPAAPVTKVRAQLARFGLDADRADTPVGNLSGGEKARLLLALATRDAPQLLILDEPTNHLDIDARDALVKALADFQGAVLLITHDPHLVELVADRLWLVADGTVRPYDGDLDDYRTLLAERARPAAKAASGTRRDDRRERAEARAALAPLRRKAQAAEKRLAALAEERRRIEVKLADPSLYAAGRTAEITAANARLAAIARDVEAAETEWLLAEEELEAAS
ncbi:MAG TPA: ABC-F family ATP-binding cassette domain-containing protein [Rhodopila sp.]|uniref:ABC-F family ATP-binding cassette domain-containing protein n=1 Tax=Rhodopila sp. TaxID=2480087 RepID=UPI002BCC3103|nr:ABC-F family ATP-binding cassette domain-containing protein [Rhodopila sp.]HVY13665.1 ABC-F family ATP-binding cassette domain-containing protein [Rhodopila sp.]